MLHQPLIDALTQHLRDGHDETHLREETLKAGYDEATFQQAMTLARQNLQTTPASPPSPPTAESEPAAPLPVAATDMSANTVSTPAAAEGGSGLISIGALIHQTLQTAFQTVSAVVLFAVSMVGVFLLIGVLSFGAFPLIINSGNIAVISILMAVMYCFVFLVGTCIGAAYVRTIVKRATGERYFVALGWSLRHFWTLLTTAFFFQFGTAGLVLCLGLVTVLPLVLVGLEVVGSLAIFLVFSMVMGYFSFTYALLVDDKAAGVKAMVGSIELVHGRWWGVFGRLVIVGLGTLACGVVAALILGLLSTIVSSTASSLVASGVVALLGAVVMLGALHILGSGIVVLYESCVAVPAPKPLSTQWAKRLRIGLIMMIVLGVLLMVAQVVLAIASALSAVQFIGDIGSDMPGTTEPVRDITVPTFDF